MWGGWNDFCLKREKSRAVLLLDKYAEKEFICNFYLLIEIVYCLLIGTNMRWKERREWTQGKNKGEEIDKEEGYIIYIKGKFIVLSKQ